MNYPDGRDVPASGVIDTPDVEFTNTLQFRCASNPLFDSPKQYVFEQRHGAGLIFVSNIKKETFNQESQVKSIQLLNTFGATISKLSINFQLPKVEPLLNAIVGNCHDNLNALKIVDITAGVSSNGEQLIRSFLQNLGTHFPNLQYLMLDYRNEIKVCPYWDEKIVKEIPSLTHLELNGKFQMGTLMQFLQSNRQIESLSVSGARSHCRCSDDYEAEVVVSDEKFPSVLFKWLDETLPNLKYLYVNVRLVEKSPISEQDSCVYLKQLQTFVCEQYGEGCWEPNLQLLTGDKLECLEINHHIDGKLIDTVAEKLQHFVNLKELTVNVFPTFKYYLTAAWSANGLREFILSKPHLTKIVIRKRSEEFNEHYFALHDQNDGWLKPYRDAVDIELNGFKWNARGGSFTIELVKTNPE